MKSQLDPVLQKLAEQTGVKTITNSRELREIALPTLHVLVVVSPVAFMRELGTCVLRATSKLMLGKVHSRTC